VFIDAICVCTKGAAQFAFLLRAFHSYAFERFSFVGDTPLESFDCLI
jgi:hypothetical protein